MSIVTVRCFHCPSKKIITKIKGNFEQVKSYCPSCGKWTITKPEAEKEVEITNPSLRRALGMA